MEKLDCKSLMIGDWVQVPCLIDNTENYNAWCQIKQLRDGDLDVIGFKELSYDELESIPLTPEILEKIGFVKSMQVSDTEPYDVDEEGNMHFSYNEVFWGWWQPNNIFCIPAGGLGWLDIKYVHQLQHILRLCGIEKEIIL